MTKIFSGYSRLKDDSNQKVQKMQSLFGVKAREENEDLYNLAKGKLQIIQDKIVILLNCKAALILIS